MQRISDKTLLKNVSVDINTICIWTNIPNHYQRDFFQAIRKSEVKVWVRYYERIGENRIRMGWNPQPDLLDDESWVGNPLEALKRLHNWKNMPHILCGVRHTLSLSYALSKNFAPWAYWGEKFKPNLRSILTYPIRRKYFRNLRKYGLGAFGIGKTAIMDFIRLGVPEDRTAVLPYVCAPLNKGADPDPLIKNFVDNRIVYMYCGTLSHRKGTDLLIKAFARVNKLSSIPSCLVLVGNNTSSGKYQALIKTLGLSESVLFRGPVKPELMAGIMQCSDVFILPSRYDGWGVVLNEAASLGKPLISTDQCGAAFHLIITGENGFRVKAGDVGELAEAMEKYLRDPLLIKKHGEQSQEIFRQFHPSSNADYLLSKLSEWLDAWRERKSLYGL